MVLPQSERVFDISCSMGMIFDLVRVPDQYSGRVGTDLRDMQSIDAAVITMHDDVQSLLRDIMYLKRSRNLLRGYGSLPGEILLEIFRWCTKERETANDPCYAFSQVCHKWRVVAISDKSLWTTPDLFRPHLAMKMIKDRTANSLLSVHVPDLFSSASVDLSLLEDYEDRIQSINISYSRKRLLEKEYDQPEAAIQQFLEEGYFPALQTLSLKSGDECSRKLLNHEINAPILHSVNLKDCSPCWQSRNMRNLTSLTVEYNYDHDFAYGFYESILSVLRNNPNLERLVLKDVMSRGRRPLLISPTPDATEPVELARLKHLKLTDNIDKVASLLPLLKAPLANKVDICADMLREMDDTAPNDLGDLATSSLEFLELNGWNKNCTFLFISIDDTSELQLKETQLRGRCFDLDVRPLNSPTEPYQWSQALADTLLTLTVDQVSCWRGSNAQDTSMDHLCTALSKHPTLKILTVTDDEPKPRLLEDLIVALEPRNPNNPHARQTFRTLSTLYVIIEEPEMSKSQRYPMFEKLKYVINRRREAGENVPKLVLQRRFELLETV